MKVALAALLFASAAASALAQESDGMGLKLGGKAQTPPGADASVGELASKGYQIRAAVPNGRKFVVFMQKDQSAYACEMQSLTASRCGPLN